MANGADSATRNPSPIDLHIGAQLRALRLQRKLSQSDLAKALGITFQQVQKYERGLNRVSGSKLYDAACCLQCPVSVFFDGLPDPVTKVSPDSVSFAEMNRTQQKLAAEAANIHRPEVLEKLTALVRVLATEAERS